MFEHKGHWYGQRVTALIMLVILSCFFSPAGLVGTLGAFALAVVLLHAVLGIESVALDYLNSGTYSLTAFLVQVIALLVFIEGLSLLG